MDWSTSCYRGLQAAEISSLLNSTTIDTQCIHTSSNHLLTPHELFMNGTVIWSVTVLILGVGIWTEQAWELGGAGETLFVVQQTELTSFLALPRVHRGWGRRGLEANAGNSRIATCYSEWGCLEAGGLCALYSQDWLIPPSGECFSCVLCYVKPFTFAHTVLLPEGEDFRFPSAGNPPTSSTAWVLQDLFVSLSECRHFGSKWNR